MKKISWKFLFLTVVIFSSSVVNATELPTCKVGESYKNWLKLSEEERKDYIRPPVCENLSYTDGAKSSFKEAAPSISYYVSASRPVKNQEETGVCWAMASTTVLEDYVKRTYSVDYTLSPGHLNYHESQSFYDLSVNTLAPEREAGGGNFHISSLYYINNYGPVFESESPTNTKSLPTVHSSTIIGKKQILDVNDIQFEYRSWNGGCTAAEKNKIKDLVYNVGPVGVSYYDDVKESISVHSYNPNTYSYIYRGDKPSNHSVTIIGWDDNYAVSNFSNNRYRANYAGAWIVQNSWGTSFGKSGIFYISYEDERVCQEVFSIRRADWGIEDNTYVGANDSLGSTAMDYSTTLRVYNKETSLDELLSEVSFQTAGATSYQVYYYAGNASTNNIPVSKMTLIASGNVDYAGYKTVNSTNSIVIPKTLSQYSIAIVLGNNKTPLAKKYSVYRDESGNITDTYYSPDIHRTGENYVYFNGKWYDLYNFYSDSSHKLRVNATTYSIDLEITKAVPDYTYYDYVQIPVTVKGLSNTSVTSIKLYKDGKEIAAVDDSNAKFNLSSGSLRMVYITKRGLSGFVNGTYVVKVTAGNGLEYSRNVDINILPITGISITNPVGSSVAVGKTLQMNILYNPTNHNHTDPTITWSSSNTSVATISSSGLVTGVSVGTTTITARTTNGKTATFVLKVDRPITAINLSESNIILNPSQSVQVYSEIIPSNTTDDKTITWTSSDNSKVTVSSNGLITAKAPGIVTIKANTTRGVNSTIKVSVVGVYINKPSLSLDIYKTYKLSATLVNADGSTSNSVVWSSSNNNIATVNSSGVVTAKGIGKVNIIAKAGGKSATMVLTVNKGKAANFTVSSIPIKTYNGRAQKPGITVKYQGKTLKKGTDYNVSYSANKYPGKATVKITVPAKSKLYTGSKTINFIIKPKKVAIKTPSTKSKSITVKWTMQPKVRYYEIQYRIKGTSAWKSLKVQDGNYFKVTGLVKGKTYQIRIRSYILVNNTPYYGAWSATKTIKCK